MATTVSKTFQAQDQQLPAARAFLREQLDGMGCPHKAAYAVEVALEELFANVAHYAYAPETGYVEITVIPDDDGNGVSIQMVDEGVAFDPFGSERTVAASSVDELQVGGLGIIMVRKTMDTCSYQRVDARNVVRVGKRWEPRKATDG